MKYIRTIRNVHLWLGLILSVFLLVEAVTGLILSEPSIVVDDKPRPVQSVNSDTEKNKPFVGTKTASLEKPVPTDVSSLVFIKQLHQGIIGDQSFRWIIDILAISIIVLTLTGIYLSIPLLRAQFKKSDKESSVSASGN